MKNVTKIAFAALLLLGACATATPYQPQVNSDGGYIDQQIETNRWAISFSGNSLTERSTVETYLLYRAAELTSQNGFDYFQIVSRDTDVESRFIATGFSSPFFYNFYGFGPHPGFYGVGYPYGRRGFSRFGGFHGRGFYGPGFGTFGGFHDPFFGGPTSFQERVSYEATAEIIMFRGEEPEGAEFFDAEDVLINLSGRIVLPGA
ncbi:MAG: hypothetical protein AAF683_04415 [Pseudomonadota bacterium]